MQIIQLTVEQKNNGSKVYRAIKDGEVIYQSAPTNRTYVAMLVQRNASHYRFGRIDLIGKGDSKWLYHSHEADLAVIDEIKNLVRVPEKKIGIRYYFETARGKNLVVWAFNEAEARAALPRRYTRRMGFAPSELRSAKLTSQVPDA